MREDFGDVATLLRISDFARDRKIVQHYLCADLTEPQFRTYSSGFLLRYPFGNERQVKDEYYGFGTPMETSRAHLTRDILIQLYEANVVLNLGPEDSPFRKRLLQDVRMFALQQHTWLKLPLPYINFRAMQELTDVLIQARPHLAKESRSYSSPEAIAA